MDWNDMCGGGPQGEWREDEEPAELPRASMGDILAWEERIIANQGLIRACQELDKLRKLRELRRAIEEVGK
jgi:hypothetical protein